MALPTFVAAGAAADGVTSATPGLPAGWQEGDIFLLYVETDDHEVQAASYLEAATAGVGTSTRLTTFWRRAGISEVTHAVGDGLYLNGARTTVDNCLVVGGIGHGRDVAGATFSGWTNADLANVTERFDDGTSIATGGGLGVVTGEKASEGIFRETTLASSVSDVDWGGFQIALAPSGVSLPTFVAAGAPDDSSGGADATPGLPAGWQAGDIHLLYVQSSPNPVTVSGYSEVPGSPVIRGSFQFRVFWRRAVAGDGDPTVSGPATDHMYTVICGFRGVLATGDPWDVISPESKGVGNVTGLEHVFAVVLAFRGCESNGVPWNLITADSTGVGTSITLTGGSTTIDDCLVVGGCSHSNDVAGPTFSGWTNADLANLTEQFDDGTITGNGGGIGIVTGEKALAGAFGSTTATNSTTLPAWAGYHIALKQPAFVPQVYRFDFF